MKKIRTKNSEMFIDEHGILHKTVIENCHIDLDALKESDEATRKLTEGKKVLMLYDARPHFTITEDALDYTRKDIWNKHRIATAIVTDKVGIKITIDYMIKVMKINIPIRIFSKKEDALKWLLTFKKKKTAKTTLSVPLT